MLLPAPGLAPGMLLSTALPGAGWGLRPWPPSPARPWGWERCWLLARGRAGRSYSLVTFWADAGGSSAQRTRSPARTSTLLALGMVQGSRLCACRATPLGFKLLSRWGRPGGRGLPSGWLIRNWPGQAPPSSRCTIPKYQVSARSWLPTRKWKPRAEQASGRKLARQEQPPSATAASPAAAHGEPPAAPSPGPGGR